MGEDYGIEEFYGIFKQGFKVFNLCLEFKSIGGWVLRGLGMRGRGCSGRGFEVRSAVIV